MSTAGGNPGISRLAKAISDRSRTMVEDTDEMIFDFGEIQSDLSLLTNTFPKKIPKGSYTVLRNVGGFRFLSEDTNGHSHSVSIPKLKSGDHVLVAWVVNTPVVLDVIASSSEL